MKKLFSYCLLSWLNLIFCQSLAADEIFIVVAADSTIISLNKRQLEHIYSRKTQINKQGKRWVPINLDISNPLRIAFTEKLFKQRPENMEAFWNIQYFKGISPPYVVSSEEAVLRFVVSTPGSIGYINACHFDSRVRVVMKLTYKDTSNTCYPKQNGNHSTQKPLL